MPSDDSSASATGVPAQILFWTMLLVVLAPSAIFVYLSYRQLENNLNLITAHIPSETAALLDGAAALPDDDARESFLTKALVSLERDVALHRHNRSSSALLTRTWMRFMSLIFGSILVVIGSAFVLARIQAPNTVSRMQVQDFGASLRSSSAGLFLVFVGAALISIPNLASQRIAVDDTSTYIAKYFSGVSPGDFEPPKE